MKKSSKSCLKKFLYAITRAQTPLVLPQKSMQRGLSEHVFRVPLQAANLDLRWCIGVRPHNPNVEGWLIPAISQYPCVSQTQQD